MKLLQRTLQLLTGSAQSARPLKSLTERELIEHESVVGRHLFGPIPDGHRREFFCLDDHTWIWHEEWSDEQKKKQQFTTRYEVHQNGVLKVREGGQYQYLEGDELRNFGLAVRLYYEQVMRGIYRRDPATGMPLGTAPATIG